ncbi:transposase family protein [Kitasatospora aureofaciens]|uniref:transposase family protein n=1 Tax=Kitasatospora aureofaciens TaxID=1894 RepID=UPI0033D7D8C3
MAHALLQNLWFHHTDNVELNTITIHHQHVTIHAATTGDRAACPSCGTSSARVHSRYRRRLAHTAAGQRRVVIELQVRRFRCRELSCPRATFVEQAAGLTFRHGRRTQGLHAALQRLALMLTGRAGSRLATRSPFR